MAWVMPSLMEGWGLEGWSFGVEGFGVSKWFLCTKYQQRNARPTALTTRDGLKDFVAFEACRVWRARGVSCVV